MLQAPLPESPPVETADPAREELRRRMRGPQRHRLLHGYPLAAAMPRLPADADADFGYVRRGGLLVGVLPHPFCNPAVRGCGFCTFPHERYSSPAAAAVASGVVRELDLRLAEQSALRGRRVTALYVGGGTANLTPDGPFRAICRALREAFDLSEAEVTLEGVPAYFVRRRPPLLDALREELPARQSRLSMGIQTFDEARLRAMGRLAFGTGPVFADVVREAHRRGMTASADLLFNLPGQTRVEMLADAARAADLGLDHLGLYHLVLFKGLGTEWSTDPAILTGLPDNEAASENWLALRESLLGRGYVQTTLTNFERAEFAGRPDRFVYEERGFRPDRYDMLGLGPGGISYAADETYSSAWKTLNPATAVDYLAAIGRPAWRPERHFRYGAGDLRMFHVTRQLAALSIDLRRYARLFGAEAVPCRRPDDPSDFGAEFAAAAAEGLLEVTEKVARPTPRGMFYADAVAATFARRRPAGSVFGGPPPAGRGSAVNNGRGHM